jgi:hypothetical protein
LDAAGRRLGANTAAYVTTPWYGPSCRLLLAACSPATEENAGRAVDPVPGAGRLLVGSIELPELISSSALHLPASCLKDLGPPPCAVLRTPADTAAFLFILDARAKLSAIRRADENCREEIAFIKSNSSHLRMTPRQELLLTVQQALSNRVSSFTAQVVVTAYHRTQYPAYLERLPFGSLSNTHVNSLPHSPTLMPNSMIR